MATGNRRGGLDRMKALQAVAMTKARETSSIFAIFCIGTGHVQEEPNNTIAALGKSCLGPKIVLDGPGTKSTSDMNIRVEDLPHLHPAIQQALKKFWKGGLVDDVNGMLGWGMNEKLEEILAEIRSRPETETVVMTGHSRGAIMCHMVAWAIADDPDLRHIVVKMIVLDPVHQSKVEHAGSEEFHEYSRMESYHAIIMENEDGTLMRKTMFPYKHVQAATHQLKRMHYIRMPGSHGSGSQNITSPVGEATMHLIANFMRARGVQFKLPVKNSLEMCELFADIHVLNPYQGMGQRVAWDDGGFSRVHLTDPKVRNDALRLHNLEHANVHNTTYAPHVTGARQLQFNFSYFFNEEHAYFFSKCFPFFFKILSAAPNRTVRDGVSYKRDYDRMMSIDSLRQTYISLLYTELQALLL